MASQLTITIKVIKSLGINQWNSFNLPFDCLHSPFCGCKIGVCFCFDQLFQSRDILKMVKRPDLTLDQRTLIKVLYKEFGQDADQIREHESLRRPDGSKVLKKTVLHWINRIEETGDVKPKCKTGRKPSLGDKSVRKLVRLVDHNPKKNYRKIRSLAVSKWPDEFDVSIRTINRYAKKQEYRESLSMNTFLKF